MDWDKLAAKAEKLIDEHGGVDGVEQSAEQIAALAQGEGSLKDKAKAAMKVVKDSKVGND
jgi:hypothetical protein